VVKEYGVFHLFNEISRLTGLTDILAETMPAIYEDILSLAFYMVSTGEPAMYCEDWLYKTESYPGRELSSQRISELMANLTNGERMSFFERWGEYRCEKEYVALDITSISTYSELINDAEWGYNRDKEKLPQINVCMLMGEKSRLPILQVVYSGSIGDISTLKTTLETASGLNLKDMSLVMDKGFSKIDNINNMLSETSSIRFITALSFTLGFAKDQVKREAEGIDCAENTIIIGSDILRGVTSSQAWNDDHNVFVHACFNPEAATDARNKVFAQVYELINKVNHAPEKHRNNADVKKYLTIRKSKSSSTGYSVKIKQQALASELLTKGWVILISNHIDNAQEALHIYRAKDVVEKGFLRMKSCLDLARLRVHSDESMQNKFLLVLSP
jgi:transposase